MFLSYKSIHGYIGIKKLPNAKHDKKDCAICAIGMRFILKSGGLFVVDFGRTKRTRVCELYDIYSNQWRWFKPLLNARSKHKVSQIGNRVYVFGGSGSDSSGILWINVR